MRFVSITPYQGRGWRRFLHTHGGLPRGSPLGRVADAGGCGLEGRFYHPEARMKDGRVCLEQVVDLTPAVPRGLRGRGGEIGGGGKGAAAVVVDCFALLRRRSYLVWEELVFAVSLRGLWAWLRN